MDSNKYSPTKAQVNLDNADEPYPSLSDYHDYEPNLEFDDTELHQGPDILASTVDFINTESNDMGSPESDFGEDNFEEFAPSDNFQFGTSYPEVGEADIEIAKHGILDVKGDDSDGRKIIVLYACKLPAAKDIDHGLFLSYLKSTLENYVEQDYSLVYFHYGLTSKNRPSLGWLVQAYKAFDRKYKKNLKALYLVHPTSFLKFLSQLFRPLISAKFGRKINYINSLSELNTNIKISILDIPQEVIDYDRRINPSTVSEPTEPLEQNLPTQQFGVTLQYIQQHYNVVLPPVVKQCVEYLDQPDALETEGLFRRSASTIKVNVLKQQADKGEILKFQDPHEAAVLLKKFFRELKEPLLTYDRFEEILQFQKCSKEEQLRQTCILVMEKLPEENYHILKYVINFLSRVTERSDLNKMNAQNLGVVFGPNLVWPETHSLSLSAIGPINTFVTFLLMHHAEIFMI